MGNVSAPLASDAQWSDAYRQMIDDLQFLALRPEETAFMLDKMNEIRHRRRWVEEREAHELTRTNGADPTRPRTRHVPRSR